MFAQGGLDLSHRLQSLLYFAHTYGDRAAEIAAEAVNGGEHWSVQLGSVLTISTPPDGDCAFAGILSRLLRFT